MPATLFEPRATVLPDDPHAAYALVVDDHPLAARGMAQFLAAQCGLAQAHVAADAAACWARIASHGCPALAVVDFWLPDGAALALLAALASRCPAARLLAVSGDGDARIADRVREAGAHGFVHKQEAPDTVAHAVAALRGGGLWFSHRGAAPRADAAAPSPTLPVRGRDLGLTARQAQVFALVLRGLPNKRVAAELALSEQTVKEHITGILARLGAANRVEAMARLHGRRFEA